MLFDNILIPPQSRAIFFNNQAIQKGKPCLLIRYPQINQQTHKIINYVYFQLIFDFISLYFCELCILIFFHIFIRFNNIKMQEEQASNRSYNFLYCIYLAISIYYCLTLSNDFSSHLLFLLTLISITSIFSNQNHRYVLAAIAFLSLTDFGLKIILSLGFNIRLISGCLNYDLVKNLMNFSEQSVNEASLVYLSLVVVAFLLPFTYNGHKIFKKQNLEEFKFLEFMSDCLEYCTPLLLYTLAYTKLVHGNSSIRQWLQQIHFDFSQSNLYLLEQAAWSFITAVFMIVKRQNFNIRKSITIFVIILIVYDHYIQRSDPNIQIYRLNPDTIVGLKLCLLLCFRVHHKADHILIIQSEKDNISSNRMNNSQKFIPKRNQAQKKDLNKILVVTLLVMTAITMILTNGLGNIVTILGVAISLPNYQQCRFRNYMAVGLVISMFLQPNQFIYLVLLFVARKIPTFDHNFQLRNWWVFIQIGRLTILLSKVSLLNFLIGLFQFELLVMFTLIFRTICSYFKLIIVFMGTEDNYQYIGSSTIPSSISADILLWSYLFILKMHSPTSNKKFQRTDITNIFYQYPILQYLQKGLKVLKIFPWLAYSIISLFILTSQPSILTLMRIVPLMMAFTVGIFEYRKSQWQERLWNWNLYTSFIIAFIKYFYLLSKYDNLSPWLIALLQPLQQNYKFIGLTPPDNISLWVTFSADCAIIIVNAIVLFIIRVELSELNYKEQKQRILQEQNLYTKMLSQNSDIEDNQERNIHYLYRNYVKPIQFKFKQKSLFRPFLTDFILDVCFLSFLSIFYIAPNQYCSLFYIPHFTMFFIGFLLQKGKRNSKYIFQILIGIGSMDLFSVYVFYFIALANGTDSDYSIVNIFCKYLFVIISVIFNETNNALLRFYKQNTVVKKAENSYYLFKILSFSIPNERLKRQVIILFINLFKVVSIGFFLVALTAGPTHLMISHSFSLIIIIFAIIAPCINSKNLYKKNWVIIFIASIFSDIWAGYFYCVVCFLTLRGYSMMMEEFNLLITAQKYGITNKTSNEEMKKRVEEVEDKFANQDKLESISEVKQMRQKQQSYISFGEESINWKGRNSYITIVWLMPVVFILVIQLGVLYFISDIFGFLMFSTSLIALIYALINLESFTVNSLMLKIVMIIITLEVIFASVYKYYFPAINHPQYSGFGLFLIVVGLLSYYQFKKNIHQIPLKKDHEYYYYIDFSQTRSQEAVQYWKGKCELVSQLGSQIHNEKKMMSLRKFFMGRQNLGIKVQQLTNQLKQKSSHRNSRFESLQRIQEQQVESMLKKEEFQIYSNMLTFMSIEDLQYCYLQLNQYYTGQTDIYIDLAKATSKARQWVLDNYEHSISSTLSRYNKLIGVNLILFQKSISIVFENQQEEQKEDQNHHENIKSPNKKITEIDASPLSKESLQLQIKDVNYSSAENKRQNNDLCGQRIDQRLNQLNWVARKLVQNIEILGLMVAAGWNFFGGVYTIPTNIAIFSWAIVLETKTTVLFWMFLMIYSSLILVGKLLLNYLPHHIFINFIFYYHSSYFYQYLIILVCTVEIIFLKMGGTSQIAYSQRENIYDAFYRSVLNESSKGKVKCNQYEFLTLYKKERHANKHSFFYRVFSKGRLKPGKDLYPIMAIVQLIILLYIFFFYDMMEFESKNNRKSLGQILTVTQFSKNMILALFFQVIIMIADRVIVALNIIDSENEKLQNFIFDFAFKNQMKYRPPSEQDLKKLSRFDFLLILKYLFHVLMLITINFFVYFYIPSGGLQKSIIPQCQNAVCGKSYSYLSVFLFLYLVYFVISGLQIKHGFNRHKCRNTLMQRYHWINYYIYMFFTGVPFLWEFKKISDWTTTATALPLFHWMKFEDINARMYQSKCEQQILKIKTLGKRVWYKYLMGPTGFFFILALIFSPIIMYSSFNPFAVQDSILAASFRLQLVMQNNIVYKIFETSHTSILDDQTLYSEHRSILGLFDRANLYKLQTSRFPDQDFMLSQPAVQQLANYIKLAAQNTKDLVFQLKLVVTVAEKEGGQSVIQWGSKTMDKSELSALYLLIICNQTQLQIYNFYSPFPGEIGNQSIIITTHNKGQYFQLLTYRIGGQLIYKGLYIFYKSSVKYKVAIGLLTFYLTYVVLINSLFRFYLTGGLQNILFEGCQLQKILYLCEAVRSARILQNFHQEEYIYWSLVDLMRYPKMIKDIASQFTNLKRPHDD